MMARRTLLSSLASAYRRGEVALPRASIETIIGLVLDDLFWPVRYHAKRVRRHFQQREVSRENGA